MFISLFPLQKNQFTIFKKLVAGTQDYHTFSQTKDRVQSNKSKVKNVHICSSYLFIFKITNFNVTDSGKIKNILWKIKNIQYIM